MSSINHAINVKSICKVPSQSGPILRRLKPENMEILIGSQEQAALIAKSSEDIRTAIEMRDHTRPSQTTASRNKRLIERQKGTAERSWTSEDNC